MTFLCTKNENPDFPFTEGSVYPVDSCHLGHGTLAAIKDDTGAHRLLSNQPETRFVVGSHYVNTAAYRAERALYAYFEKL